MGSELSETFRNLETVSEWKSYFDKLHPRDVGALCNAAMSGQLGVRESFSFYVAGIDRLRDIGHMSIATTEEQRRAAVEYSAYILSYVEHNFADRTEALEHLRQAITYSDKFYGVYGDPHIRQFLHDRGFIDAFGAELRGYPPESELPSRS